MSQEVKTITLVALAVVCGIAAMYSSREAKEITELDLVGTKFVNVDPLEVTRLKVARFDPVTGERHPFEVAKSGDVFSIPSHEGYPADAKDRIKDSVNLLNGSDILALASKAKESHEDFGVLDPEDTSLGQGATGVGMRVTMSAGGDEPLADFIIGKEVKGQKNQHYVRKAGQNEVYVIEIQPDKLSTKFEDWVERDFLKFNPWDMEKVAIDNYSLRKEEQVDLFRGQVTLALGQDWNSKFELGYKNSEWKLDKFETFDDQKNPTEVKLADDEELNKTKLNAMKDALDDLEIVDVRRKPENFNEHWQELQKKDPKVQEGIEKILSDLQQRGFFVLPPQGPDEPPLFLSDNGELNVGMEDGVQYTLRFGNTAGAGQNKKEEDKADAADKEEAAADGGDDKDDKAGANVLRYLLVTAKFDESLLEQPELKEVPPEEPPAEEPAEKPADKPASEPAKDSAAPNESPAADDADKKPTTEGDKPTAPEGDTPSKADGDPPAESQQPCGDEPAATADTAKDNADDAPPADPATDAPGDETAPPTPPTDEKPADTGGDKAPAAENGDEKTTAADAAKDAEAKKKKKLDEWKKNRDDIIKENDRKQKEYDDKVAKGKKRVDELNERFEAWYYVISDETYNKIRLGRDDIIKKKEKKDDDKNNGAANGEKHDDNAPHDDAKSSIEKFNELKNAVPTGSE